MAWTWCPGLGAWAAHAGAAPAGYAYPVVGSNDPDLSGIITAGLDVYVRSAASGVDPCTLDYFSVPHVAYYDDGGFNWQHTGPFEAGGSVPSGTDLYLLVSGPNYDITDPEPAWDPADALAWLHPVTTIYSTTSYGYYQSSDADYETARAGAGDVHLATADYLIAGQETGSATFYCYEAFIAFDTSAIVGPYVASLQLTAADVLHDSIDFTLEARLYDWGPTLTAADWVAGADLAALPLLGTWDSTAFVANPDYNIFTDFDDGLNLTGTTKIIIVGKNMTDGNPPAMVPFTVVGEYATFNIVLPSGTTLDAKLVITQPAVPVGGWGVGMVRMGAT